MNVLDYLIEEKLVKSKRLIIVGVEFVNASNYRQLVNLLAAVYEENVELKVDIYTTSDTFEFFEKLESKPECFDDEEPFRNKICGLNACFVDDVIRIIEEDEESFKRRAKRFGISLSLPENWQNIVRKNIFIRTNNLPHGFNAVLYDDVFLYAPVINGVIGNEDYIVLEKTDPYYHFYYTKVMDHIDYLSKKGGKKFLSTPETEMIGIYQTVVNAGSKLDGKTVCRGTAPRSAFYFENAYASYDSIIYKRHSVWEFIFNRNGKLLLHQRSKEAKDNNMLWDKSAGGHVDRTETSTAETAKRELIEELFYERDMDEKHLAGVLSTITDYGEWIPLIRPATSYKYAFEGLPSENIIMFHATNKNMPWTTEGLVSKRRLCIPVKTNETETLLRGSHSIVVPKYETQNVHDEFTYFISDVYFFITPKNMIDTEEQMYDRLYKVYEDGAAYNHKLVTIDDLQKLIIDSGEDAESTFTSDLLYLFSRPEFVRALKEFSLFVKNQFSED